LSFRHRQFFITLFAFLLLVGCEAEPVTVEVSRLAEVTIEVTRPPEVIIEATDNLRDLFYRYEAVVVTRVVGSELQTETGQQILALLAGDFEGVEQVTLISWSEGLLEIELVTSHPGKDAQPAVSWDVLNGLAPLLAAMNREQRLQLTGSERLDLQLTTFSVVGDFPYQSRTEFEKLVEINDQALTRETWEQQAGADFR